MTTLTSNYKDGSVFGGRMRRYRAILTLAAQDGVSIDLGMRIPPGHVFAFGVLSGSVSLGSSTLAIGISGATGKYRAAATHTATTATMFGVSAAVAATTHTSSEIGSSPLGEGTNEDILATVATAALPGSGTLVIDMYFSAT